MVWWAAQVRTRLTIITDEKSGTEESKEEEEVGVEHCMDRGANMCHCVSVEDLGEDHFEGSVEHAEGSIRNQVAEDHHDCLDDVGLEREIETYFVIKYCQPHLVNYLM